MSKITFSIPDESTVINEVNRRQDATQDGRVVAAQYVILRASQDQHKIGPSWIETALDSLIEHGARFDYSKAYNDLTRPEIIASFNEFIDGLAEAQS